MLLLENALGLSHRLMESYIPRGGCVIDATVGNGNDTLFFCQLVGDEGRVYGFDIQQTAIERAREKLCDVKTDVWLYCDGHQNMAQYISEEADFIGFNLGFLPAADKTVTTLCETTKTAVLTALTLLKIGGVCCICCYPGHDEGGRELEMLEELLADLDCRKYAVVHYRLVNANGRPPELFAIQRCK